MGVVVEVVVEFVGDFGDLLEEIVGVFFTAGAAGVGEEVLSSDLVRASRKPMKTMTRSVGT